ncbi:hypothetical protein BH23CHL2_BH23CHL2_30080 [soil metagenome]
MAPFLRYRRTVWLAMLVALFGGMIPFSAAASSHHTATRTEVTFTSTVVEVLNEGEEWVDEAGIFHFRGFEQIEEVTGDISGTVIINFNGDFEPVGECTEDACPAYFSFWGRVEVTGEDGGWVGTYVSFGSDVPGEEFFADSLVLRGTGGNAHNSIVAQSTGGDESSITFEGILSTMATPMVALNSSVRLCADPEDFSFGGSYLSSGAIEGHGGATGEFLVGGGPWTHTYAVAGTLTLSDEHGTVTIGFGGGVQDTASPNIFASHAFGHFVILGGTGDYAELYGSGRLIAAASDGSTCASGFGVNLSLVGEAHYN